MLNVIYYYDMNQMVIPNTTKENVMEQLMGIMVLIVIGCVVLFAGGLVSDYLDKRGF